ncbi:MAG: Crp/Fnr family transcriptional regulator [Tannerellaceae bacterium]|nr:Crp/Fnr family transcriptional regulator [Tannerellaceae bacterium]
MKEFNTYVSRLDYTSLREWMQQEGEKVSYGKGAFFVEPDQMNRYIGYVEEGAFRYSCIDREGKNRIVGYAFRKEFVGNYAAFREQQTSPVGIQALGNSTVYRVTHHQVEQFFTATPENQYLGRRIAELLLAEVYDRLLTMYITTPEEQYREILSRCPEVLTLVSLKEIASFLRITPETLSRIRKK